MNKKISISFALLIAVSMILSACQPAPAAPAPVVQTVVVEATAQPITVVATPEPAVPAAEAPAAAEPKILRMNFDLGEVPSIDPALATDVQSIQVSESTYVGLTRLMGEDEVVIKPGMASSWDVAADGMTYTFHLRTDVPWVKWDAIKNEVVKIPGCEGKDRMVTAKDFEYAILRALDPKTASDYAYVLAFAIDGASAFNSGKETDAAKVGVKAIDDATLEIKFAAPAAYNPMIAGIWTAFATPRWAIDGDDCTQGKGDRWTEQGNNQAYGPFVLKEWIHDASLTIVKNPFWPGDENIPQPKIDEIHWTMLDQTVAFTDFEAGNQDVVVLPPADTDRVKTDPTLSQMLKTTPRLSTDKFVFNAKADVVSDVRVRLAMSKAIDRQSLIDNVLKANQEPARWFCRPGLVACPTVEKYPENGVQYDPEGAKKLLDEYLAEKNTTADKLDITLYYYTNSAQKQMIEAVQQMWKTVLGIDVKVVNQEFKTFAKTVRDPKAPQIWNMGWGADYPDTNNFTREVLSYGGSDNPADAGMNWKNDTFEKLVAEAAVEQDPEKRMDLYAQAEQIAVIDDAVIIPLYWRTYSWMTQPYVKRTFEKTSYQLYEKWDIVK